MIGEEIDYDRDHMKGLRRLNWFCCSLSVIVFIFLAYAGLVDKSVSIGGMRGAPVDHKTGSDAVFQGYVFYTFAVISLALGFCYDRFKILIWLIIAIAWIVGLFLIHRLVV